MKNSLRLLLAASTLAILTACGNNSSGTSADAFSNSNSNATSASSNVQLVQSVDAYRPPASATAPESPMKPRDLSAAPTATNIALGAPLASQTAAARKNNATPAEDHMGKPLQIGFGRDVAQTATTAATNQVLKWQATQSGGQVAAINFTSTGAKGIRIGLLVTQLPETAILRFYAKGAATAFEVKGAEVLAVLAKNLAAGDTTDEGRTYVSPVIKGTNATVEIELPAGVGTSAVQLSVPKVSHLFMSMTDAQAVVTQATYTNDSNRAETCHVDVTCTSPLPAASDAVGWLIYDKFNTTLNKVETFICSGTLLNDNINSSTPYILTANHCISSQTVASTLYTEFKYRSLSCNNATTGQYFPTATTGAALLYTAYSTDSTLLRLYGTPSTSVLYAGWDSSTAPAVSTSVHSIHHPAGDQQRLTRGAITGYFTRTTSGGMETLSNSTIGSGTILGVTQTSGTTEGGSSGSGLLKGTDVNPVVIGQLYGRLVSPSTQTDSCADATETRIYGRFDVAYNAGMSDWLTQGVKSVIQLYNASTGVHYYTIGLTDANAVTGSNPAYSNQGTSFKASTVTAAGLSPVYRFYDTVNGTYFYTISEKERAAVATNTPRMRYDGIVWYASTTAVAGTQALYRAFNTATGSQFFTTNSSALSTFLGSNPQFKTDGIAYYVPI
ncbi:MAG: trypsin-like peptidase domain-containing protein [Burkholderiaceae bacterium]